MTLNIIVGEKILIYNCCFDNLIAAVTDYIYIYIRQDEKNIILYFFTELKTYHLSYFYLLILIIGRKVNKTVTSA